MTSKEVAAIFTTHNYILQLEIPNSSMCFGKKTIAEATTECPSLSDYFDSIARRNGAKQLIVKAFSRNGTSFKPKGQYLVSYDQAEPISPVATPATSATQLVDSNNMRNNTGRGDLRGVYESLNDANHPAVLQVKLAFTEQQLQDWKGRAEKAEKKIDELQQQNIDLLKENKTKDERHALEKERVEMNAKNGLSGILEEVKSLPPESWQFFAGMFPNHPMNKALQGTSEGQQNQPAQYHDDNDANVAIRGLIESLRDQQPEVIGLLIMCVNKLTESPNLLKQLYLKLYPQEGNGESNNQQN